MVQIDGEPWFAAGDTCKALGLLGYASKHTSKLGSDERKVLRKSDIQNGRLQQLFEKSQPSTSVISESGLYKMITRSDKPEAKPFQEWVTRDVLPFLAASPAPLNVWSAALLVRETFCFVRCNWASSGFSFRTTTLTFTCPLNQCICHQHISVSCAVDEGAVLSDPRLELPMARFLLHLEEFFTDHRSGAP